VSRDIEVTVYRTGTFSVAAPEVEGKCGVFGKTEFKYDAWFTAGEDDLDDRGFIVDNADLHRYFLKKYSTHESCGSFVSCEVMVLTAIKDFRAALADGALDPQCACGARKTSPTSRRTGSEMSSSATCMALRSTGSHDDHLRMRDASDGIARVRGGLVAFLCRVCIRLGKAAA
jgi:hypothetical protein